MGQSKAQLDQLIFEPVLLDPDTHEETGPSVPSLIARETTQGLLIESSTTEQLASGLDIAEGISEYRDQVISIESENGPFSTELYQALLDLAAKYQQLNDHESAIEIYERAEHISRINHGLFHPEQFASIEGLVESYLSIGDIYSATQKQRYLIYLSEQHFGNGHLNSLPSMIDLADQNMDNFNRLLNQEKMPQMSFTATTGPSSAGSQTITPQRMAFGSLFQAQNNYYRAISTILENEEYFDPRLIELEYNYIETLFLQSFRTSILNEPDYYISEKRSITGSLIKNDFNRRYSRAYFDGKDAFERLLIYVRVNPQSKVGDLITTLIEYGDWYMLFDRSKSAHEKYLEAYNLIQELSIDQDEIDQILRPPVPVHLPLFTAKPNSREKFGIPADKALDFEGYMDISFTINRYGRVKDLEIGGKSENASKRIERRLLRYLRNSPFRPRLRQDGTFESERVSLRYYFAFADRTG